MQKMLYVSEVLCKGSEGCVDGFSFYAWSVHLPERPSWYLQESDYDSKVRMFD